MVFSLGDSRRHRRAVHDRFRRASFRARTSARLFATTEAAQGTSFDEMVAHQKQVAAIIAADTNIAGFMSAVGGSSTISGSNQGRLFIGLKPRDQRVERRRDHQGAAAEAGEGAGHRRLHAESAGDSDRRPRVEEPVSVHDAELGHRRRCIRRRSKLVDEVRKSDLLQDVTSDLQLGNPQASVADRSRARGVARRHGAADRDGALQRVRLAPGLDDLHAEQRVLGRDGAAAAVSAGSVGARACCTSGRRAARSFR